MKMLLKKCTKAVLALVTRNISFECDSIPYHFNNLPYRKIINWILLETSITLKLKKPWGLPTHFLIEPTTFCNLRCALCPVTEGMDRPSGHMEYTLFKKLIDEIKDYALLILMWDWGEPFLNPNIYKMISYARDNGIKVVSSSNGHLFTDQENAKKLVESGINSLIIAVDGITQQTYEQYRKSGNLEQALQGIANIQTAKRNHNSDLPLINFRFIAMKHNEHEIPALKDFARSMNLDVLSIKTLNPYSNDTYHENRSSKQNQYDAYIPENEKYRRFKYNIHDGRPERVRRTPPCKNLWNSPAVHWDGGIFPCTYDYNDRYSFGNLQKKSFKAIWFGERYQKLRDKFRTDWQEITLCANCGYAFEGGSCWNETIAEVLFNPTYAKLFANPDNPLKVKPYGTALETE